MWFLSLRKLRYLPNTFRPIVPEVLVGISKRISNYNYRCSYDEMMKNIPKFGRIKVTTKFPNIFKEKTTDTPLGVSSGSLKMEGEYFIIFTLLLTRLREINIIQIIV